MKKIIIVNIIILAIASLSLVSEDFLKFLLSGHSATYDVSLVKHSCWVVFGISLIFILINFLMQKSNQKKILLGISFVFLILSLKTYAVDKNTENVILVSGFSFIPINKCEITEFNDCDIKIGFFLKNEVEKAISD